MDANPDFSRYADLYFQEKNISRVFLLIIGYFAFFAIITLIVNPGSFISCIYQIAPLMALCSVTEYYMRQNSKDYLQAVLYVLILLIAVDLVTIILYPNGMYTTNLYTLNWFLGYKTARVRVATLPVILFAAILSIEKKNKLDFGFWAVSALALVDTYASQGTGGVAVILLMLVLLFCLFMFKNDRPRKFVLRLFNFRLILFIVLIVTFMFNVLQNFSVFEPIITGILGKDMTLSGRLRIWEVSLQLIRQSPFVGNGYISSTRFARLVGMNAATQPHSLFLSVLVYTGVAGLIIYLLLLNASLSYVKKTDGGEGTVICAVYIICMLVHGIVSIHLFSVFLYPAMIMLYYMSGRSTGNVSWVTGRNCENKNRGGGLLEKK